MDVIVPVVVVGSSASAWAEISPEHLLLPLIDQEEGVSASWDGTLKLCVVPRITSAGVPENSSRSGSLFGGVD